MVVDTHCGKGIWLCLKYSSLVFQWVGGLVLVEVSLVLRQRALVTLAYVLLAG